MFVRKEIEMYIVKGLIMAIVLFLIAGLIIIIFNKVPNFLFIPLLFIVIWGYWSWRFKKGD